MSLVKATAHSSKRSLASRKWISEGSKGFRSADRVRFYLLLLLGMSHFGSVPAEGFNYTTSDLFYDLDLWSITLSKLRLHHACLSEYDACIPSTLSKYRLYIGYISDAHDNPH